MLVNELETFVKKFEQLWRSGHNVHLDVDSQAGNASVSLHLQLGRYPGPIHVPPAPAHVREKVVDSPSRARRRARREAARAKKVGINDDDNTADIVVDDKTAVEETCKSVEKVEAAENGPVKCFE